MSLNAKDKKNVLGLGFISLMNDASSEMIYPLLPIFLTSVLHASASALGVIEGLAETTVSVLKYISGSMSDRVGKRKPIFAAGYTISNLVRPFIGIATSWWHVLFFRLGDRVGKGIRTSPRDALLADSVPDESRGFAFGFQRAMDNLGAIIGPLIATALIQWGNCTIKTVFLLSIVPGIIAIALAYFVVTERAPKKVSASHKTFTGSINPRFSLFLIALLIFTLGNSTDAFLLLKAQNAGVCLALIPIIWMVLSISKTIFAIPGGRLSDKIGRKPVIIGGWVIYGATYLGFAFAGGQATIWGLFFAYGLYFGLCEGTEKAFVAELTPEKARGNAYGLYNLAIGIGALPASVIFGLVWDMWGSRYAFIMGALLALIASIVLAFVKNPVSAQNSMEF